MESRTNAEIWSLESGCTPDYIVWIHSGVCSSDTRRSLKSRRSLEVEFTLETGVWSHIRSLQSGFTPESVVWSLPGVC